MTVSPTASTTRPAPKVAEVIAGVSTMFPVVSFVCSEWICGGPAAKEVLSERRACRRRCKGDGGDLGAKEGDDGDVWREVINGHYRTLPVCESHVLSCGTTNRPTVISVVGQS